MFRVSNLTVNNFLLAFVEKEILIFMLIIEFMIGEFCEICKLLLFSRLTEFEL